MRDNLPVVVLALAIFVVGVLGLIKEPVEVQVVTEGGETRVVEQVGAAPGPDVYNRTSFFDGVEAGGKYTSVSTTSATYTLTANQFKSGVVDIESSATGAALTLTLPASNTAAYPATAGMHADLVVKNSHTAAATTTTIAAGTGVDLQEPDGQNVVIGINNYALLRCFRLDTRDVACTVTETIPAD